MLTVGDIERTVSFYRRALGIEALTSAQGRPALQFGAQKINLHEHGREIDPHAERPTPAQAICAFSRTSC